MSSPPVLPPATSSPPSAPPSQSDMPAPLLLLLGDARHLCAWTFRDILVQMAAARVRGHSAALSPSLSSPFILSVSCADPQLCTFQESSHRAKLRYRPSNDEHLRYRHTATHSCFASPPTPPDPIRHPCDWYATWCVSIIFAHSIFHPPFPQRRVAQNFTYS